MSLFDSFSDGLAEATGTDAPPLGDAETGTYGNADDRGADGFEETPIETLVATLHESVSVAADDTEQFSYEPADVRYVGPVYVEETAGEQANFTLRVADTSDSTSLALNPLRKFSDASGPGGPTVAVTDQDMYFPVLFKVRDPQEVLMTVTGETGNANPAEFDVSMVVHKYPWTIGKV